MGGCRAGVATSVCTCLGCSPRSANALYVRRSEPHLLMHQQIWALLLPLSCRHPSAHLSCWDGVGRTAGRCPGDNAPAHPSEHNAELGVHTQQPHSLPWTHESPQPARSSSMVTNMRCSPVQDGAPVAPGFLGPCHLFGPFWTPERARESLNSMVGVSRNALAFPSSLQEKSLLLVPVLLKLRLGPGAVRIWGSPSLLCWRQEGGSRPTPIPRPTSEGFTPAARSPATAAQPHARSGAHRQVRLC